MASDLAWERRVAQFADAVLKSGVPWSGTEGPELAEKLKSEIAVLPGKPRVVNVGLLNAGKSSLWNAVGKRPGALAVADARCTSVAAELDCGTFTLIDTPGLDSTSADEHHAALGLLRADVVVYVHSLKMGELVDRELRTLRDIQSLFPAKTDFAQRVLLACTKAGDAEDPQSIEATMCSQVERTVGVGRLASFAVSSRRYEEAMSAGRPQRAEHSGVPALRTHLESLAKVLADTVGDRRHARLGGLVRKLQEVLSSEFVRGESNVAQEERRIAEYDAAMAEELRGIFPSR